MKFEKPKKNDRVFIVHRKTKTHGTVTKVGRVYFYVKLDKGGYSDNMCFFIEDWNSKDSRHDTHLYPSKKFYLDNLKKGRIKSALRDHLSYFGRAGDDFTLEQYEQCAKILNIEVSDV